MQNSNKNLIKACILRSKYILYAQAAMHSKKEVLFFTNRLPANADLPSLENIQGLDNELFVFIDGLKRDIANYLRPIYHEHNVTIEDKLWFSSQELKDGYVLLSTKSMENFGIHDRVLILSDIDFYKNKHYAGTIVSWETFNKVSKYVEGVIEDKTFVIYHAMRKMKNNK